MRPRKTILLVSRDEIHADTLQMVLETRGHYQVVSTWDALSALELIEAREFDMLLGELLLRNGEANELARMAKTLRPEMPVILFSSSVNDYDAACYANQFIPESLCNSETILEVVALLICKKRGPKTQGRLRSAA